MGAHMRPAKAINVDYGRKYALSSCYQYRLWTQIHAQQMLSVWTIDANTRLAKMIREQCNTRKKRTSLLSNDEKQTFVLNATSVGF
ncbi:hypothetical protein EAG_08188 [Camponotus floridanus]|uniref:Uncharacterized protein n=1 Tax=Camponotus floridanus TaxID=104421 RepID=E2AJF9_CAMFO|nr:hypothetical protein EAG_08188 [Camponotus floridanus]